MAELPIMPYLGDAYLADTRHLSLEEHGAYHLLLLIAWRSPNQAIPDDDKRIAQMLGITAARWAKLRETVLAFWTLTDAGYVQKKQKKVWQNTSARVEKRRKAAEARWGAKSLKDKAGDDANAYPNAYPNADATKTKTKTTTVEDKTSTVLGASRSKRRKAAKPIPTDWKPLEPGPTGAAAMIERNWPRGRREKEIEAFTAHHGSRANVMVDWQRAWQTWVLNSEKFDRNRSGSNGAGNQSTDRTLAAAEGAFGPFSTWSDNEQF